MKIYMTVVMAGILVFTGCASKSNQGGLAEREVGGLTGAGMSAGTGAIVGSAAGNAAGGTAIAAPVDPAAGDAVDEGMRRTQKNAVEEAREDRMALEAASREPAVTSSNTAVESPGMVNPRTGQHFPAGYVFDPRTGDVLDPVRA